MASLTKIEKPTSGFSTEKPSQPFGLLDLPTETRVLIYKRLSEDLSLLPTPVLILW
jgi:hypothetical protein